MRKHLNPRTDPKHAGVFTQDESTKAGEPLHGAGFGDDVPALEAGWFAEAPGEEEAGDDEECVWGEEQEPEAATRRGPPPRCLKRGS